MSKEEKTIIELGKNDAAFVVRDNNDTELIIPALLADNPNAIVPENLYNIIVIAMLMTDNDEVILEQGKKLKALIDETMEIMEKE